MKNNKAIPHDSLEARIFPHKTYFSINKSESFVSGLKTSRSFVRFVRVKCIGPASRSTRKRINQDAARFTCKQRVCQFEHVKCAPARVREEKEEEAHAKT